MSTTSSSVATTTLFSLSSAETEAKAVIDELVQNWKVNFIRISLRHGQLRRSYSWINNTSKYATQMTDIVNYIGTTHPGVYVLLTVRSDASFLMSTNGTTLTENAYVPTAASEPMYKALVDSFANASWVIFGLANEPDCEIENDAGTYILASAMNYGIEAIRAEEAKLGTPPPHRGSGVRQSSALEYLCRLHGKSESAVVDNKHHL